jgi:S-adenosylmethionine hydrolase
MPSLLQQTFRPNGVVVFLSDFGIDNDAVAVCKGVMLEIDPTLRIIDLTHGVEPFRVREGAIYLDEAADYYPPGTVFVGVVDPGVGTARRALVLLTADSLVVVAPDNGLASLLARDHGVAGVWEIANPTFARPTRSTTFDGRDLFAPTAARLASGRAAPAEAGPAMIGMVRLAVPEPEPAPGIVRGIVLLIDEPYGNVWTNMRREDLLAALGRVPARLRVRMAGRNFRVPLARTFGDVPEGMDLAYFNSRDQLSPPTASRWTISWKWRPENERRRGLLLRLLHEPRRPGGGAPGAGALGTGVRGGIRPADRPAGQPGAAGERARVGCPLRGHPRGAGAALRACP